MVHRIAPEITRNEAKDCNDPTCHRKRERVSGYCKTHGRNRHLYGHPRGRTLDRRQYAPERSQVSAFLNGHIEHPAVVAALGWLQEWLEQAWRGNSTIPAIKEFQQLREHEITAIAILVEVVAVWLFSVRSPNSLPDDQRLNYAMSLAVLSLAPKRTCPSPSKPDTKNQKRPTAPARRDIGKHMRSYLAPLFNNIRSAFQREEERVIVIQTDLRTPFT